MQLRAGRLFAIALLLCAPAWTEIRSLTILHTNDLHARLSPLENGHGGFAYLAALIRQQKEGCKECILLNAGDLVQGTPVSTIFHGLPVYEVGNLLGFDVSTLGNHEFDYGWPQVQKFMKTATYPIVTSNVVDAKGRLFTEKPYVILNVNGVRVAVIGALTDTLPTLTTPNLLGEWHTIPFQAEARKYASEVKDKADVIVLLAHIAPAEEQRFLREEPEFNVIVSGHAHSGMAQAASQDGRVLVRVKGYGEELGRLDLKFDTEKKAIASWKWQALLVDSTKIKPAPDVAALVKHWEGEVTARVDQPLAISEKAFTKAEVKGLIERALRDQTGADFAWMNMGGVRDLVPKGQLLVRNIWNIMPFDNRVVVGTFKGKDIPAKVVAGRAIDPEKDYTLAVSDFTAANQATPENLGTTGLQFPHDVGLMRDILIDWFRKQKTIE
ncbi:MAG TPA: bifunctional UDP-sugar hydrolase/5'-nucleotidase [Candidatus Sulfopaludibacter sp.]|jgi:2',3'-cyclic-nucleotide 2'-phosphodiesterase (5'-nucleotidase family)|nr:bifunctional UDP-sugar hydrolase/5'-nucleotidase [Candidatus Sulfopaludibacter sp.]